MILILIKMNDVITISHVFMGISHVFMVLFKRSQRFPATKLCRWKVVLWPLSSKDFRNARKREEGFNLPFDSGRISTFCSEDLGSIHASRQGYNANCVCVGFGCIDYIYISSCIIWLRDELCHYVNTPHDLEDCLHMDDGHFDFSISLPQKF